MNKKYEEFMLTFKLEQTECDYNDKMITIKAFGQFNGQLKIFEAVYGINDPEYIDEQYEEMIYLLRNSIGRKIKVLCKIKDQKIKKFKFDLSSLVLSYNNDIFNKLELLGYGISDKREPVNTIASQLVNNKIVLGLEDNRLKILLNGTINLLFILLIIPIIVTFLDNPILGVVGFIFLVILKYIISNNFNSKIIIQDSIIRKKNLYRKQIELGNVSNITSYAVHDMKVTVLTKDKDLFSFLIGSSNANRKFYEYLKNNYKQSIRINNKKIYEFLFLIYGMVVLLSIPAFIKNGGIFNLIRSSGFYILFFFFIIKGYNKCFYIVKNKITYKKLFVNKKHNIENITKIEYQRLYHRSSDDYNVIGYIGNQEVFMVNNLTPEELQTLKNSFKEYNPNCYFLEIFD